MLSEEKLQRFFNRVLAIAKQKDQPITIGFRERGIIDPFTGEKYLLTHIPFPLRGIVICAENSKPIEIQTTCYIWRRYQGPF